MICVIDCYLTLDFQHYIRYGRSKLKRIPTCRNKCWKWDTEFLFFLFILEFFLLLMIVSFAYYACWQMTFTPVCLGPASEPFPKYEPLLYSASTVLRHVILCLPRLRLPSGVQCKTVSVSQFGSFLRTSPTHFYLFFFKISSIELCLHSPSSCSFDIRFFVWEYR